MIYFVCIHVYITKIKMQNAYKLIDITKLHLRIEVYPLSRTLEN